MFKNLGIIKDKDGEIIMHRTVLKIIFNPILRKIFKCSIVSHFDENNNFVKYQIREYPKYCKVIED